VDIGEVDKMSMSPLPLVHSHHALTFIAKQEKKQYTKRHLQECTKKTGNQVPEGLNVSPQNKIYNILQMYLCGDLA
jgi:hypothetical protein